MEAKLTELDRLALYFDENLGIGQMAVQPETFETMFNESLLGEYRDWEYISKPNTLPYFIYKDSRKVTSLL